MSQIGGLAIRNTAKLIDEHTRICALIYGYAKLGKTRCAASLDALTKKHLGKPSLFIAVEAAEGGGTMSIQDLGVDFVQPSSIGELDAVISGLASDKTYGGVILDSATEAVKRLIMPHALRQPYVRGTAPAIRAMGVPQDQDYQSAGEFMRQRVNSLVNLTTSMYPPELRKHFLMIALKRDKTDRKSGEIIYIGPDLPGQMAEGCTGMFQTVAQLRIKTQVGPDPKDPKKMVRTLSRILTTETDGIDSLGDRTGCFGREEPANLLTVYEQRWLPRFRGREGGEGDVTAAVAAAAEKKG